MITVGWSIDIDTSSDAEQVVAYELSPIENILE